MNQNPKRICRPLNHGNNQVNQLGLDSMPNFSHQFAEYVTFMSFNDDEIFLRRRNQFEENLDFNSDLKVDQQIYMTFRRV